MGRDVDGERGGDFSLTGKGLGLEKRLTFNLDG
jgi:hypothetical protein